MEVSRDSRDWAELGASLRAQRSNPGNVGRLTTPGSPRRSAPRDDGSAQAQDASQLNLSTPAGSSIAPLPRIVSGPHPDRRDQTATRCSAVGREINENPPQRLQFRQERRPFEGGI